MSAPGTQTGIPLGARETKVLRLIATRKPNPQTAAKPGLSVTTAERIRQQVRPKPTPTTSPRSPAML